MTQSKWAIEPKGDYPDAWQEGTLQAAIRDYANHRCEHCHMLFHYGTNKAVSATNRDGKPCIGTVHHISGDKADVRYENLVYLCQICHLSVQSLWSPGGVLPRKWATVPEWIVKRGLSYQLNPQLVLL